MGDLYDDDVQGAAAVPSPARQTPLDADGAPALRIIILSDVRLYRDVLQQRLAEQPGVTWSAAAASASDVSQIVADAKPTIVLLDMSRAEAGANVRALLGVWPTLKIIAFGVDETDGDVLACAEAGVAAFVPRGASLEELVSAVDRAWRGELVCSPRIVASLFRRIALLASSQEAQPASELTRRERQIVHLIDGGLSNKEIAQRLSIEVATVKNHVHRILEKLAVRRRGEAAARIRRANWKDLDADVSDARQPAPLRSDTAVSRRG